MLVTDGDMVAGAATRLLLLSAAFQWVEQDAREDREGNGLASRIARMASAEALGVINNLCLTVRNLQDKYQDRRAAWEIQCGEILKSGNQNDCRVAFNAKEILPSLSRPLGVRDALNKFAHFDDESSGYILKENKHFMVLKGEDPRGRPNERFWTVIIDIEQLALACMESVRQLRSDDA